MSPYLAEFLGTMLLVTLGDGVVANVLLRGTKGENAGYLTIVIGWGLAVIMGIYAVERFSGAHINPAITLALWMNGDFEGAKVPGYISSQLGGAFSGAVLVWIFYKPFFNKTDNEALKLAVFCTSPAVRSTPSNLLSEVFATLILVLAVLFIGANEFTEGLNPIVIGALIISIGVSLGGTTGFAINPARDLGPRLAHFILPIPGKGNSDWRYSWIPVIGPVVGGILGAWIFKTLFI